MNLTPCSSQRSNSRVKVKSVSPRRVICPAYGAANWIARSIQGTQPSWLTTLPGRLTRVEHFVGVGERDHQRGITPDAFVGKSHAPFAFPESRRHRAVGIDKGLCQKTPGLLSPHSLPHRVGYLLQSEDIVLLKATGVSRNVCRFQSDFTVMNQIKMLLSFPDSLSLCRSTKAIHMHLETFGRTEDSQSGGTKNEQLSCAMRRNSLATRGNLPVMRPMPRMAGCLPTFLQVPTPEHCLLELLGTKGRRIASKRRKSQRKEGFCCSRSIMRHSAARLRGSWEHWSGYSKYEAKTYDERVRKGENCGRPS